MENENMELMNVIDSETALDVAETPDTETTCANQVPVIGMAMVAGAALWELGIKPMGRKIVAWVAKKQEARKKAEPEEETETDFETVDN